MKDNVTKDRFLQKRAERQKRIRKRRLIIFFISFIILLLCVATILCLTVFFPIKNINVTGSKIYNSQELLKASGIELGDNLFALTQGGVLKELKSKLPYVDKVELKRELPGNLQIIVTDAEEYIAYYDGKTYFVVSESGMVLKGIKEKPQNLCVITGIPMKCKVGNEILFENPSKNELVEEMLKNFKAEKVNINLINVSDEVNIYLKVDDRFEVNFGTQNYSVEKIKHLAKMIENIEVGKTGTINLSMWSNSNQQGSFVERKDK